MIDDDEAAEAREEKAARKWLREHLADRVNETKPTLKEIAKKHNILARTVEDLQRHGSAPEAESHETRIAMLEATVRTQSDALTKLIALIDDLLVERQPGPGK